MAEARNSVELGAFSFTRPRTGSIEVDGAIQIDLQVCHKNDDDEAPGGALDSRSRTGPSLMSI